MQLKKYTLGEIAEIYNGSTPSTKELDNYDGEIIWATPKDLSMQNSKYFYRGERNITQKGFDSCSAQMIPANNILMSSRAPIGLFAINKVDCCTNQGFKNIVLNKSISDVDFMYYFLKYHVKEIESLGSGTTFKEISKTSFENFKISIPPLPVQQKIAAVLSALDEKIALNSRINAKLEAMAKRLYDYWFMQFEFPFDFAQGKPNAGGTFGNIRPPISQAGHTSTPAGQNRTYKTGGGKMVWNEQLKREIPEGWEVVRFKDCIKHINTGLNPRDNFALGNGNIKYITVKNLTEEGIVDFSNCDFIDENAQLMIHNRSDIQIGDILLASICPLGRCYLINEAPKDWDINESVFAIRPNYENITSQFLYLILRDSYYVKKMNQKATGSIFKGIRVNDLEKIEILLPPKTIIDLFTEKISPILNQQSKLQQQSAKLTALRDRLLPLLMNGQVAVSDNSEQTKQNSGLDYEKKFNKWLQNQGLAARGHVDMKTLRAIFNAMDDDDK